VCHERRQRFCLRCCADDEGGPLGLCLQEPGPNHLKLLRSRGVVVSVQEKSPVKVAGEY
jgi:hypothetical protein